MLTERTVCCSLVFLLLSGCQSPPATPRPTRSETVAAATPAARSLPAPPAAVAADPVARRVRTQTISGVSFGGATGDYTEVVKLIRTVTDLPIVVTPQARATIAEESLRLDLDVVAPMSVADLLDLMVAQSDQLGWLVRNDVVELTSKAGARGETRMVTHDVRDLLFATTEFLPPKIGGLPSGDGGGSGARTGGEADEKVRVYEPDLLVENVKAGTAPEYWDAEGGGSIEATDSGYLIVRASPEMQRRVARFLDALR